MASRRAPLITAVAAIALAACVVCQLLLSNNNGGGDDAEQLQHQVSLLSKQQKAELMRDLASATKAMNLGREKAAAAAATPQQQHKAAKNKAAAAAAAPIAKKPLTAWEKRRMAADAEATKLEDQLEKDLLPAAKAMGNKAGVDDDFIDAKKKAIAQRAAAKKAIAAKAAAAAAAAKKAQHDSEYGPGAMAEAMKLERSLIRNDGAHRRAREKAAALAKKQKQAIHDEFVDPRKLAAKLAAAADNWDTTAKSVTTPLTASTAAIIKPKPEPIVAPKKVSAAKKSNNKSNTPAAPKKVAAAAAAAAPKKSKKVAVKKPVIKFAKHTSQLAATEKRVPLEDKLFGAAKSSIKTGIPSLKSEMSAIGAIRQRALQQATRDHNKNIRSTKESKKARNLAAMQKEVMGISKHLRLHTSINDIKEPPVLQRMEAHKTQSLSNTRPTLGERRKIGGVPSFSARSMERELTQEAQRALRRVPNNEKSKNMQVQHHEAVQQPVQHFQNVQAVHAQPAAAAAAVNSNNNALANEISSNVLSHLRSIVTEEVDKDLAKYKH